MGTLIQPLLSLLSLPRAPGAPPGARADVGFAAALALLGAVEGVLLVGLAPRVVAVGLGVLVPLALVWRRARPLAALAVPLVAVAGARLVWGARDNGMGMGVDLTLAVLTYALVRWGSGREVLLGAGLVAVVVSIWLAAESLAGPPGLSGISVLDAAVRWGAPAVVGYAVRVRDGAFRARVHDARQSERVAIARELHDTVAHHVTAIAVQAQAARATAPSRPEAMPEALLVIEEAASRVLADMRVAVGALRSGAERTLQRGVADLAGLASDGTPSGDSSGDPSVEVDVDDDLGPLAPTVGAGLYRIAQEAVTNARRHARAARTITVRLTGDGDRVRLVVRDDGKGVRASAGGFGLVGMRERAVLLGGSLDAGPGPEGGWRVEAVLPRRVR